MNPRWEDLAKHRENVYKPEPAADGNEIPRIDSNHNITRAGVWPTIDTAKEIADATAERLLHGATITCQGDGAKLTKTYSDIHPVFTLQ